MISTIVLRVCIQGLIWYCSYNLARKIVSVIQMRLIEFIESYRIPDGADGGDYQWNDNHGRLIRCKDCKWSHMTSNGLVKYCDIWFPEDALYQDGNYYCADAKLRGDSDG